MNPEYKALWVDRLRNGGLLQGTGSLRRRIKGEDYYCCLGVLCEIAVEKGVVTRMPPSYVSGILTYDGEEDFLPLSVRQAAGLDSPNPFVPNHEGISTTGDYVPERLTLSWLNDTGYTFSEIADIIERNF